MQPSAPAPASGSSGQAEPPITERDEDELSKTDEGDDDERVKPDKDGKEEKVDHRKRKRNRTIRSCVPCHNHKRKCDRQRPCGRCTALGLVSPPRDLADIDRDVCL